MTERTDTTRFDTRSLHTFLHYLTEQFGRVAAAYGTSLLTVILALLLPWPLKFIIDNVLADTGDLPVLGFLSDEQQLAWLAGSMAVLAAIAALVRAADKVLHARVRERFSFRLRDDLIQKVYGLSRDSRQSEMSGELTMRLVSDTQLVSRLICKTLPTTMKHALTAVATLVSIFLISRPIGFASLIMAGLLVALVASYGPKLAQAAAEKRSREGHVSAHTQESINGIEHIQAMALEEQSRRRYLRKAAASLTAGVDEVRTAVRLERSSQVLAGISLALVVAIGGLAVVRGNLMLGELTVCLAYIAQLLKPIEKINEIATSISRGIARAERICSLFAAEVTPDSRSGLVVAERIRQIDCRGLEFRYRHSDVSVVSGFDYSFRVGECTSIVGPSGCGKSTLLRLVLGLQAPTSGTLSANGRSYEDLNLGVLRKQFAVLLQDAHLFAGSIRDIVTEANDTANDAMIQDVLRDVHLSELIDSLPFGLETAIDEAGARFSVGQRARLLLARALLSQRPVLLLDEPFANLDGESKRIILSCLIAAKKDRILIIVTHEQALLDVADRVLTAGDFRSGAESGGAVLHGATAGEGELNHASAIA